MSLEQFKWNKFSEVRPHKVKQVHNIHCENHYLGKFMVRLHTGKYCICEYMFPSDDDLNDDAWKPRWKVVETDDTVEADDGDLWYPMNYVFDMLDGYPTPYSCWEFGCALAEFAIPALSVWIEKCVSYKPGMTPDEWHDVLKKIRRAFEVSLADMSGETPENDEALWEEHKRIRKEGFALLAEHYLDMWD